MVISMEPLRTHRNNPSPSKELVSAAMPLSINWTLFQHCITVPLKKPAPFWQTDNVIGFAVFVSMVINMLFS
jgi:hypothetical protein